MKNVINKRLLGYIKRFTIVHVITYILAGVIFMNLQDYENAFATLQDFEHFRSLSSPIVKATGFFQIIRGIFIALVLYPFYDSIIRSKNGWLKLFGVLWGLTFLVSVKSSKNLMIGSLEVTIQMIIFSWLFFIWERKAYKINN
ncbi:MAG: hypothetical protein FH753_10265 [Firmicutes bacterium]|nr:hypothetical protein [Bacillota bacterium]